MPLGENSRNQERPRLTGRFLVDWGQRWMICVRPACSTWAAPRAAGRISIDLRFTYGEFIASYFSIPVAPRWRS
jgi:hypothetical protein